MVKITSIKKRPYKMNTAYPKSHFFVPFSKIPSGRRPNYILSTSKGLNNTIRFDVKMVIDSALQ